MQYLDYIIRFDSRNCINYPNVLCQSFYEDILGFYSFLICLIIILFILKKNNEISLIILSSFIIKSLIVFFDSFVMLLPENREDGLHFYLLASKYNFLTLNEFISTFISSKDFQKYAVIIGGIFSIFGKSYLLMKMINVFISIISTLIFWKIAKNLFDKNFGSKIATFFFSFHPAILIYSTSVLREPFIVLILLITIYFYIKFIISFNYKYLLISLLVSIIQLIFHPGMLFTTFLVLFFSIFYSIIKFFSIINILKIISMTLLIFIVSNLIILNTNSGYFNLNSNADIIDTIFWRQFYSQLDADSGFPNFLVTNNPLLILLYSPIRLIYFIFSPFYISKLSYLLGFLTGFINLILLFFIIKYYKISIKDYLTFSLFSIFIILAIFFSIFTGSSGTAFRHRAKFDFLLLILSIPFFEQYFFKFRQIFIKNNE